MRTSIAIIALGFVVARFGLLLRELGHNLPQHLPMGTSTAFGTALIIAGAALTILATLNYLRTGRSIDADTYRPSPALILLLSAGLVVVGVLLALYLVLTA